MTLKIGALLTHPIQYYSPWLAELAGRCKLKVYYAYNQTAKGQAAAGFGKGFEWDVPLLEGYDWQWLKNVSPNPGLSSFDGCDTPEIASIIQREQFDAFLMFGWNRKCFAQAARAARKAGTPVLVRVDSQLASPRAWWKRALKAVGYRYMLRRMGHYMSPGRRTDAYLRHYGVPDPQIHRVPHMIDTERFASGARAAEASGEAGRLRATNGAGNGACVLLFVGKLIPKKRPGLIIDALERLKLDDPNVLAKLRVWIVGDGPLRETLEARVANGDLPVSFLGFANQSELPAIYAAADCLVLPSDSEETWGLVVNEAFACGLSAIVSNEAGCAPDMIEDGVTGWTLMRPDADELAGLMARAVKDASSLPKAAIDARNAASTFARGSEDLLSVVEQLRAGRGVG